MDWIGKNDAEARQILQQWTKVSPEVAQNSTLSHFVIDFTPSDLDAYAKLAQSTGTLTGTLPNLGEYVYSKG